MKTNDDPKFLLRVPCVECRDGVVAPLPIERDALVRQLAGKGWFLSVLSPPGHGFLIFGALCPVCAKKVYSPELLKAAEEARVRLLSS